MKFIRPRARFRDKISPSRLERKFMLLWQMTGGPPLESEYRFHAERKWRADFAHVPSRTLLEIEGGLHIYGRHNRAEGFAADCEKYLEAALAGWRVLRLTYQQLNITTIERIVQWIQNRKT